MFRLYEYGELNQSKLMSYCGLNNVKHKEIIDELVDEELVVRSIEAWRSKTIIKYRVSEKGRDMINIRQLYNNFIVNLQEFTYAIGASKRIQVMSEYIDTRPGDIILDIGGNTGKVTEAYSNNCKEVVVLEPKHSIVEYGKSHRPNIKFVEGQAENIPLPDKYFDKVVASASFHHFSDRQSFRRNEASIEAGWKDNNPRN